MSPTDIPPVTTPHAAEIIGSNYPTTSESGTAASVVQLFQQAAESVGTGDTAEVMFALIEANATGQTPTKLLEGFSEDKRAAFNRALNQINMGQGASVMAQDILNTKVQLNGTAVSFEAAVQELIASYAGSGGPESPRNQAEFTKKYHDLLDQAKKSADQLGSNHKSTQDSLVAGVQKGATPEIPSTMAPTSSSNPSVPGMPDGALGSLLQNVGGQMMKPPNLPMPNLAQGLAPITQPAQAMIGELMKKIPGGSGVPITQDALAKLAKTSGVGEQGATLSGARTPSGPAGSPQGGLGPGLGRTTLAGAHSPENARATPVSAAEEQQNKDAQAHVETTATTPTAPASTAAPAGGAPATTLSSGHAVIGADSLSSPSTHTSAGDGGGGAGTATLSPTAAAAPAVGGSPMPPMMPPMMGGAPAGAGAGSSPASRRSGGARAADAPPIRYQPQGRDAPAELLDFGADLKGLAHATDAQVVAASIAAGLARMHAKAGLTTEIAVGVSAGTAVFVTSDGLGFLPPDTRAASHLTPLMTLVPDSFVARWLGCSQPWRPLLEAAGLGLAGPFDAVVATDPDAEAQGVLVLGPAELDAVNITAGTSPRWNFDAIEAEDIDEVLALLRTVWGQPWKSAADLEELASQARWSGQMGPVGYAQRWAHYLLSAAMADLKAGDVDDARYALRCALRIPESVIAGVAR